MKVAALVVDLADRVAIGDEVTFVRTPAALAGSGADLSLVDLAVPGALEAVALAPGRVIAFGPHVASDLLAAAEEAGAEVLPRSRFFRERPWLEGDPASD